MKIDLDPLISEYDEISAEMNAIFLSKGLKIYDFSGLEEEEVATWYLLKSQCDRITAEIVKKIVPE